MKKNPAWAVPQSQHRKYNQTNLGGNQFPHLGFVGWVTPWQFLGTNFDGLFVFPKDKYDYVLKYTKN